MKLLQQLLPGEDLFGLLGRSLVMGTFRDYPNMRRALGLSHYKHVPGMFLSRDFSTIASLLGKDLEQLHAEHTCFNMLKSSLNDEQLSHHECSSKAVTFHGMSDVIRHPWRWCSQCVIDDTENYGVAYYHRDHQIPGVKRCHKHQCSLITQCYHCNYEVTSIKAQPIPPEDGLCPRCGASFDGDMSLMTPTMLSIEKLCLDMAYGHLKIEQSRLIQRVQEFWGGNQDKVGLGLVRKDTRAFYRQLVSFYDLDELQEYFYTGVVRQSGVYCPPLQSARIYDSEAAGLPLHPLAVALIWHFLEAQNVVILAA